MHYALCIGAYIFQMRIIPMLFHAIMRLYKLYKLYKLYGHIYFLNRYLDLREGFTKKVAVLLDVVQITSPPSPQFGQLLPFF